MNAALFVKTLQVRQQGRLRELHRLWCWPQRSSHGQDQLGYRPCTLTRGPAPKSRQPLFYLAVFFVLILSPEIARRSSQKNEYRFQFISLSRGLKIFPPGRASDGGTRCPIQVATVATATSRRVGPAVAGRRSHLISAPSAIPLSSVRAAWHFRRRRSTCYGLGRGCGDGRVLGIGVPRGVGVGRGVGVAVAVGVTVGVGVSVGAAVAEGVGVSTGVALGVGVAVGVAVGVIVDLGVGVAVGVGVSVAVGVDTGVAVGVEVAVGVGVGIGLTGGVKVAVAVGLAVGVAVGLPVGVGVGVGGPPGILKA